MNYEYFTTVVPYLASVNDQLVRHIDRRTYRAVEANIADREVGSRKELEKRIARMRAVFASSIGPMPYNPASPLNARVTGVIVEDELSVEKVVFQSRPHVYVTATVYVPKGIELPAPAILFQPGHSDIGKAYPQYQQVARTIAAHGMIVMLMDPPGQGERLNYWEKGEEKPRIGGAVPDHNQFGSLFYLAGRTPAAYFLSDAMRAIDYLLTRPDVDPMRIGATGSSGGGTMTSVLAVMDPRVAAAAPGTFLTTRDAITVAAMGQDIEQMWPGTLAEGFDHHELIACFAPKPYLILAVDADAFPIEGAYEIYEYGKKCYELMGTHDNLELFVDRSLHKFTLPLARAAGRFFAKHFGLPAKDVSIENVPVLTREELNVTASGQVVWEYPDAWPMWREAKEFLKNTYRPAKDVAARGLSRIVGVYSAPATALNFRTSATGADGKISHVMWLAGKDLPVFGAIFTNNPGKHQPVTVAVFPNGLQDITTYGDKIDELLDAGRTVLVANLTGRGNAKPGKMHPNDSPFRPYFKADSDLIFLGDSLAGMMIRDLLGTLRVVSASLGDDHPEILAAREASVWARVAERMVPSLRVCTLDEVTVESLFEDPYYDHNMMYSIRAQGLAQYLK